MYIRLSGLRLTQINIPAISKRALRLLGAFLCLGFMAACATPLQTLSLRQNPPDISLQRELVDTPFFPQTEYHCGPAALATVMQYFNVPVIPDELAPMIYTPGLQGALQVEMVAASRRFEMLPVQHDGKFESLLREIEAGNPVLVLQNLGLDSYPFWHYAVVVGYDIETQSIVLRSGTIKRLVRSFEVFERTWQRSGYWALIIVPPDQVPVTANAKSYLQAVLDLEQTGHVESANKAYGTATRHWPDNLLSYTGLGNTAYRLNNFAMSELAYQQGLTLSPQSHQLWNNLAYAQARLGKKDASMAAISRAIELAPDNQNYQDSLSELKQLLAIE
ncbi:MAG: PA2778 family cysteine peptidase [Gammaproteobacteria bacterium]|nr:PA2778 family cysteine peptidase [Gammaproteobacteria bacterium]